MTNFSEKTMRQQATEIAAMAEEVITYSENLLVQQLGGIPEDLDEDSAKCLLMYSKAKKMMTLGLKYTVDQAAALDKISTLETKLKEMEKDRKEDMKTIERLLDVILENQKKAERKTNSNPERGLL